MGGRDRHGDHGERRPFFAPTDLWPWQHALLDLTLGWIGLPPALYHAHLLLAEAEIPREALHAWLAQAQAARPLFHLVHRDRDALARANIARTLSSDP